MGLSAFIQDLAYILITAAVVTVIFKRLKQPVILGYLIAGLLLSPSLGIFKQASSPEGIQTWASIGVIFLMLNLGMEFSFRRLLGLGRSAVITSFTGMAFTFALGFLLSQSLGYNQIDSIFVGGMLCLSSTMIILKSLEDLNLKSRPSSQLLFGVMIIEDLVSILLLVLLSTLAATRTLSGNELVTTTLSLALFIASWLLLGMYFLPRILKSIRVYLNEETILIVTLGLCLLMVVIATEAGFSSALGAFVMGSLLAETKESERIMDLLKPIRHLFSAIFFVSVGMLIDPQVIFEEAGKIALFLIVVIFGKPIGVALGAVVSGRSLKDSVTVALSMPQVGEFSYVIASLGLSLGVLDQRLYPLIVAVSCVTVFLTPIIMGKSKPVYNWLNTRLPNGLKNWINRYDKAMQQDEGVGLFTKLMQSYAPIFIFSTVGTLVLVYFVDNFLVDYIVNHINLSGRFVRFMITALTLVILSPLLWALLYKPIELKGLNSSSQKVLSHFRLVFLLLRLLMAMSLVLYTCGQLLGGQLTSLLFFAFVLVSIGLLSKYLGAFYHRVESNYFITDETAETSDGNSWSSRYTPWEGGIAQFEASPMLEVIGQTLVESKLKDRFGATIVAIERHGHRIIAPRATERILPYDRLHFVGDETQLASLEKFFKVPDDDISISMPEDNFKLDAIDITTQSQFAGKSIKDSGLSEAVRGLVVGIERQGTQVVNPTADQTIEINDRLWIVGISGQISNLKKAELKYSN